MPFPHLFLAGIVAEFAIFSRSAPSISAFISDLRVVFFYGLALFIGDFRTCSWSLIPHNSIPSDHYVEQLAQFPLRPLNLAPVEIIFNLFSVLFSGFYVFLKIYE